MAIEKRIQWSMYGFVFAFLIALFLWDYLSAPHWPKINIQLILPSDIKNTQNIPPSKPDSSSFSPQWEIDFYLVDIFYQDLNSLAFHLYPQPMERFYFLSLNQKIFHEENVYPGQILLLPILKDPKKIDFKKE